MSFTPTCTGIALAPSRAGSARDNRNNNASLPQAGD